MGLVLECYGSDVLARSSTIQQGTIERIFVGQEDCYAVEQDADKKHPTRTLRTPPF
jgi:cold shock CspA family protein